MTPNQIRALDAIRAFHDRHRVVPTVRQLAELLGYSGPGQAQTLITALIETGELVNVTDRRSARKYRLADHNRLSTFTTEQLLGELKRRKYLHGKRGHVLIDEFFDAGEQANG